MQEKSLVFVPKSAYQYLSLSELFPQVAAGEPALPSPPICPVGEIAAGQENGRMSPFFASEPMEPQIGDFWYVNDLLPLVEKHYYFFISRFRLPVYYSENDLLRSTTSLSSLGEQFPLGSQTALERFPYSLAYQFLR